jgi:hypothetical protein
MGSRKLQRLSRGMRKGNMRCEIIYEFTRFLPDKQKSKFGKYYTPRHLVEKLHYMVSPHIKDNSIILDAAAGCGAFLETFKNYKTMGRDIDGEAVETLESLEFESVKRDNSLYNVDRKKYGLNENDHLVIIGNPPYNDWTSKNKKTGRNAKEKYEIEIDSDVKSNDLGMSFLKAFEKLKADVICVLHPLSYLIKETNFRRMGSFVEKYYLEDALIFSSREFSDTQQTPFPIVIALYLKGKMDYEYILNFRFNVLNKANGSEGLNTPPAPPKRGKLMGAGGTPILPKPSRVASERGESKGGENNFQASSERKFVFKNIETIDGYIRKYPPKKNEDRHSDIGLYMYNIRDLNSLLTSGNLTEKVNFGSHITIDFKELYKYAYLNCMKRYFEKDFLFGNLSPIVLKKDLENDEYFQDIFVIDTILNNQKLSIFDVKSEENIIKKYNLVDQFKRKTKNLRSDVKLNPYKILLDFLENNKIGMEVLKAYIKNYFLEIKNFMLSENDNL